MGNIFEEKQLIEYRKWKKQFYDCIEVVFRYCLKEIEEQKRMCKTMESAGVLNDLPEPLKTKENERYSKLKKDSKTLKEYLDE